MTAPPEVAEIVAAAGAQGLALLGGFHPEPDDGVPEGQGTLFLIGPGPDFWPAFAASPELKTAMHDAGVTSAPTIWFTTRA